MKIRLLTSVAFFWLLANNQHYVENQLRLVELAEKAAADLELRIDALRCHWALELRPLMGALKSAIWLEDCLVV